MGVDGWGVVRYWEMGRGERKVRSGGWGSLSSGWVRGEMLD